MHQPAGSSKQNVITQQTSMMWLPRQEQVQKPSNDTHLLDYRHAAGRRGRAELLGSGLAS